MKSFIAILFIAVLSITISSCDEETANTGSVVLHFDNMVGTADLQLNTPTEVYTNASDESYKVSTLMYYVSNIRLKKADGTYFTDPVSSDGSKGYYLVNESDAESTEITLNNIPAGDYIEVTFTIGVDASQVDQGAQKGALDPANNLFWSWNSGYIFMALEGVSSSATTEGGAFMFHVGGYKEDVANNQVNNIRTVTLGFNGDTAPIKSSLQPEIHMLFDVNKLLDGDGETVTFTGSAMRHSPKACENLADNIPGAFVVDHIHAD